MAATLAKEPAPRIPDIVERSSDRALKLGKALGERKALMFGAYWCPYCDQERQELGKDVFAEGSGEVGSESRRPMVRYVECDARGEGARPDLCAFAGVRSFPTWALSDPDTGPGGGLPFKLFPGARGLLGLERMTGLAPQPRPEPPEITSTSGPREIALAKALTSSGAKMYGTWWCRFCDAQRQLFGKEAWAQVPYVECDPRSPIAEPGKCTAAGVEAFPEWVLPDGSRAPGLLTLERLQEAVSGKTSAASGKPSAPVNVLPMPDPNACENCNVNGAQPPA